MEWGCDNCGAIIPLREDGTPEKGIVGGELAEGEIVCGKICYDEFIRAGGVSREARCEGSVRVTPDGEVMVQGKRLHHTTCQMEYDGMGNAVLYSYFWADDEETDLLDTSCCTLSNPVLDLQAENLRLAGRVAELEAVVDSLSDKHDRTVNTPCAQALDELWKSVILKRKPDYGDWEYPMQAKRHIEAEFTELLEKLDNLHGRGEEGCR